MSKNDMGPFAGMDAALERAITSYGTPPYREIVSVEVRDVGGYSFDDDLPTTLSAWIAWLTTARDDALEEYRDELNCVLKFDSGSYDEGCRASLKVWYDRPETDEEMTERVNRDERATYEALKRKYG